MMWMHIRKHKQPPNWKGITLKEFLIVALIVSFDFLFLLVFLLLTLPEFTLSVNYPLFGEIVLITYNPYHGPRRICIIKANFAKKGKKTEKRKKLLMHDFWEIFVQYYTALFSSCLFYYVLFHWKSIKVKYKGLTFYFVQSSIHITFIL